MQTFRYPHFPQDFSTVHVALFTDVTNSADIRSRIVRASQLDGPDGQLERDAVNFAFVDPRLVSRQHHLKYSAITMCSFVFKICSVLHLQTAIHQAVLARAQGSLRTKTVHSEILWALNPTNNACLLHVVGFISLNSW